MRDWSFDLSLACMIGNGYQFSISAIKHLEKGEGRNHLMFMNIDGVLKKGEMRNVTLVFEEASTIDVAFEVWSLAKTLSLRD